MYMTVQSHGFPFLNTGMLWYYSCNYYRLFFFLGPSEAHKLNRKQTSQRKNEGETLKYLSS